MPATFKFTLFHIQLATPERFLYPQTRTLVRSLIKMTSEFLERHRGGGDMSRDYWIFKGRWFFFDGIIRSEIAGTTLQCHTSSHWELIYEFTSLGRLRQDFLLHINACWVRHKTWISIKKPNVSGISGLSSSERHWQ